MAPVTVNTRNILEAYNMLKDNLNRKYTIKLEFEAYTPVWTGGFNGKTSIAIQGQDQSGKNGNTIRVEQGPTAKSIIGVARWLLRSIGPCEPENRENRKITHRTCEKAAARAFGTLGRASPVIVEVALDSARPLIEEDEIESLEKAVKQAGKVSIDEAELACKECENNHKSYDNKKNKKPSYKKKYIKNTVVYTALAKAATHLAEGGDLKKLCGNDSLVLRAQEKFVLGCCDCKDSRSREIWSELSKLFPDEQRRIRNLPMLLAIPRFLINALGKNPQELKLLAPLAPGHNLTVKIYPRNPDRPDWGALALAAGSIAVALAVLGVGKATTRGFGRYKLVMPDGRPGNEHNRIPDNNTLPMDMPAEIREKLIKVLEHVRGIYEADNPWDSAKQVLNSLSALRDLVCHVLGLSYEREREEELEVNKQVLLPRLVNPEVLSLELRVPDGRVDEVLYLLYRISAAVQKSEWKKVINRDLKEPGPNLHTWPLGLPRHNTNPKSDRSKWTGYFYVPKSRLMKCCENFEHASANALRVARMKSPLILFPVPRGVVAVVPRLCYTGEDGEQRDMGLLSALLEHKDNTRATVVLVHSGINSKKKRVRRIPVGQIIEHEKLPKSCEGVIICPDPESVAQKSVPGGIMGSSTSRPDTVSGSVDVKACKAWLAAVEWVRYILGPRELGEGSSSG